MLVVVGSDYLVVVAINRMLHIHKLRGSVGADALPASVLEHGAASISPPAVIGQQSVDRGATTGPPNSISSFSSGPLLVPRLSLEVSAA